MWRTLQKYIIDNCLIRIIKELYAHNRMYIKQKNRLSQPIYPWKDLRSCGLSLLLYNIYLSAEGITKLWEFLLMSSILSYADDQIIFAQDAFDMLKRLSEHYHNWILTICPKQNIWPKQNINSSTNLNILSNLNIQRADEAGV